MTEPLELARLPADEALVLLGSSPAGLTQYEAARRLADVGPNVLPQDEQRTVLPLLVRNVTHPLAFLLAAAAVLALVAGLPELALAIGAVVAVNGGFAFLQEWHAYRLLAALELQVPKVATVMRDGRAIVIPAAQVVPGDVVALREGDRIPADARLLTAENVTVDNSSITGEAEPLARMADAFAGEGSTADLPNLVLAGTFVQTGMATAVVYATGERTELGKVVRSAHRVTEGRSLLERQVDAAAKTTAGVAVSVGLLVLLLALVLGERSMGDALVFAVGVIVALTPEGLLPTVTLALAMAATRIAQRHAIVRRLSAVEVLGGTTVICTDKTGTLTTNRLSVTSYWAPGMEAPAPMDGSTSAPEHLRLAAWLASEVDNGGPADAIDLALAACHPGKLHAVTLRRFPFDVRLRRTTLVRVANGEVAVWCKGAPESVLPLLADGPDLVTAAAAAGDALAHAGLRVIALARGSLGTGVGDIPRTRAEAEAALHLVGLVGLLDPPRPDVPAAVEACRRAGIRVHVISGDHAATARAVAEAAGLRPTHVLTGDQLDRMGDEQLRGALAGSAVFARVTPQQKLRVVENLQRMGEVVAVTGDGVNDAPALRKADVGVAMGGRGTEAARQASDIILLDDNFSTIVAAIQEGRTIFDNIQKFATYIFTSNVAELVPFVAFILLGVPLALPVLLVLAIDLGTDVVPALALAAEPPEPAVMDRPPRSPAAPLLDRRVLLRALLFLGAIEAALGMGFFFLPYLAAGWQPGEPLADAGPVYASAKAAAFLGIVAGQVGALFACRSPAQFSLALAPRRNPLLAAGLAWELALSGAIAYLPPLSTVFGVQSPGWVWALMPGGAAVMVLADDARKGVRRLLGLRRNPRR